jgi:hypothetical protein
LFWFLWFCFRKAHQDRGDFGVKFFGIDDWFSVRLKRHVWTGVWSTWIRIIISKCWFRFRVRTSSKFRTIAIHLLKLFLSQMRNKWHSLIFRSIFDNFSLIDTHILLSVIHWVGNSLFGFINITGRHVLRFL